eukprot:TRINITY_DN2499_c1_g1_i17.p1 TRINITY_DN2499_c1_g1~~TRINITY_DN2499_c1_g1_i17.p1  ORF type:complete len:265 (-),score=38.15 TRINITY_DN2499_c1_g1_i17:33-827(-)
MEDIGRYVRAEDECFMCFVNAHGDTSEGAQYIWDGIKESAGDTVNETKHATTVEMGEGGVGVTGVNSGKKRRRKRQRQRKSKRQRNVPQETEKEEAEKKELEKNTTREAADHYLWVLNDLVWPITRCSLLREKPKLIFINACRGHGYLVAEAGSGKHLESSVPDLDKTRREGQEIHSLKEETDCLFVFSTTDDTVSFRDRKEGTYFVRALVEAFEERGQPTNVLDIMTRMNDKVKEMRVQKMGSQDTFGQAPVVVSTLVKTLRL